MTPVVTPEEMRAIDAASPVPVTELIERAGSAVARSALRLLGGAYGRHVVVVCGPGNNGADGRVAARRLAAKGVRVRVVEVSRDTPPPPSLPACELVIDAAFGTGFRGVFDAPVIAAGARVLAVDLPSGVDGPTGLVPAGSHPWPATVTITFAALKPCHLFGPGAALSGRVEVADIGLDVSNATIHALQPDDLPGRLPSRQRTAHKWTSAVAVIAGSPGMTGAAALTAAAASRAGAGMVRLGVPGVLVSVTEAVSTELPEEHWVSVATGLAERCHAIALGPGLGRTRATRTAVRSLLVRLSQPVVVDADALVALSLEPRVDPPAPSRPVPNGAARAAATDPILLPGQRAVLQATARRVGASAETVGAIPAATPEVSEVLAVLATRAPGTTILTPHDGEFERLTGHRPGADRIDDARALAATTGAVVLLKGPTTVIAAPSGRVELVIGDARLATAGSGDILTGIIAAFLAAGLDAFSAASTGALVHAEAAMLGHPVGLIAGDLPPLVARVMSGARR